MPILQVRALPQSNPDQVQEALKETCIAIAAAYGCPPEHVWGTWEELKPGFYVEGRNSAEVQPTFTHPPIAQLTCFQGKSPEQIERVLLVAGKTLSTKLGLPDNIFIQYIEATSGRVLAGNGLIRT